MIKLETPLASLSFIRPSFQKKLSVMGLKTVRDLLWHFPNYYEDFSKIYKIADLEPGQYATISATVERVRSRQGWFRQKLHITEASIYDETGSIKALWFNQPYVLSALHVGQKANFSGKISLSKEGELRLSHPTYEPISRLHPSYHTARIVPVYSETRGLTSKGIRYFIQMIFKELEELSESIPLKILAEGQLPEINTALSQVHFPKDVNEAINAKRRFAFEELFLLQLFNLKQKFKISQESAVPLKIDIEELKKIISALPFELTFSQKRSLWEIIQDLQKNHPMNRLLQGDVGSGKTVVAALAALMAAKNGYQAAFLAPTEILAKQHFETLKKLFSTFSQKTTICLLTSNLAKIFYENDLESNVKKNDLLRKIADGEMAIVIGTHALIQKKVQFKNLALVIVDEQHRFGVKQRSALLNGRGEKGKQNMSKHFLSMSATPIPRTLNLTIFGDLDLSAIDELPKGRIKIITRVVAPGDREKTYDFIHQKIKEGRQAFVICPRIDPPSEDKQNKAYRQKELILEIKSVKEEYEKLSNEIFPDLQVAMLHGKIPAKSKPSSGDKSKEEIMNDFSNKNTDILVSTSVIEVGIDIPNATIIMIEGSERFGLAQLYQLRGRVGRGKEQSYCFLFTDSNSIATKKRLKAITEAKNGFELAEQDLKMRGPGEIFGTKQTGLPDLAMKALQNPDLVKLSREKALQFISADSKLSKYPLLKKELASFESQAHLE